MGLQRQKEYAAGLMVAGALSVTLLAGGSLSARADDGLAQGRGASLLANTTIDLDLAESPLKAAIRLVEQKTGINVVVRGGGGEFGNVTLSVKDKPINTVLKLMAESANADFWEQDGVFYFGPKGSAPKPVDPLPSTSVLPNDPFVGNNANNGSNGPKEPSKIEKIRLLYSDPRTITHFFGVDNNPMGMMMEIFVAQSVNAILEKQNPSAHFLNPFRNAAGVNINTGERVRQGGAVPSAPTSGNGYEFNPTINGDKGGSGGGGGGQFGGGQGFGGQGVGGQGIGGQGVGGPGGQNGQNQGGQATGLLPEGITGLFAISNDGSLLVKYDNAAALKQLRDILRLLDVKPRQLQLKAEFVTVTQNDINNFGINFQFQKVNLIGGTNTGFAGTSGQAFLQYATGNLSTQLSFALSTGHAKLVASPMATTLNNMPVTFQITTQVPVFTNTVTAAIGGQTIVTPQIGTIPVTTGISIFPRINGDDSISLFGSAVSTAVGAPFTGPDGSSFPNVTQQNAPIQRIIRNGDTMVIAGLNSKNDVVSTFKVPLLGDVPFIGNLFRSRSITTNDSELLVFITATILPERISTSAIGGGVGPAPTGGGGGLPLPGVTP